MAQQIAIDSNMMTYLIEAMDPNYDPSRDSRVLRSERVAMLRCFLYVDQEFYLVPTVITEYQKIAKQPRYQKHRHVHYVLLHDVTWSLNVKAIARKVKLFQQYHSGPNDCQILAEVDDAKIPILLTLDPKIGNNLQSHTCVRITKASDYWSGLGIPHGAKPVKVPHITNPLGNKRWWQW